MAKSSIEWTDATWNPVTGCTRVSRGCDLCYAATLTRRLEAMGSEKYSGLINSGKSHFNGHIKLHPDTLDVPLRRNKPTMYFVNSMSDLFHPGVPMSFIVGVFEVMAKCPQHVFQVLTKRPERMAAEMSHIWSSVGRRGVSNGSHLSNVWLGTSVEDSKQLPRVTELSSAPAAIRFLSCEPLLGPLHNLPLKGIDWVIVGGESGRGARPFNTSWAVDIIDQCQESGVACFVKQLGANPYTSPAGYHEELEYLELDSRKGGDPDEWPQSLRVRSFPVAHPMRPACT